jgi:hypothetical protein
MQSPAIIVQARRQSQPAGKKEPEVYPLRFGTVKLGEVPPVPTHEQISGGGSVENLRTTSWP